jgi:hypothetical protein
MQFTNLLVDSSNSNAVVVSSLSLFIAAAVAMEDAILHADGFGSTPYSSSFSSCAVLSLSLAVYHPTILVGVAEDEDSRKCASTSRNAISTIGFVGTS